MTRDNLIRNYKELNRAAVKGQTLLAGSSLMENFHVNELLMSRRNDKIVYNRGIGGMTIEEYEEILDTCVFDLQPSKLFINIGSNDLNLAGDTVGNLISCYRRLLSAVLEKLPECRITLLAYYPCLKGEGAIPPLPGRIARTKDNIDLANTEIEKLASELDLGFLNLNQAVSTPDGYLMPEMALDDIHFSQAGYIKVLDLLEPYL